MQADAYPWLKKYPKGIAWNEPFFGRPLYELLDDSAAKWPNNIALDFYGKTYTYRRLQEMVNRIAKGLTEIGVGRGTKVGLFMPNCPQFVMAYYAILKTGATVVNFNPLYSSHEIAHQLKDAGVEVMFTVNLRLTYAKLVPFIGNSSLRKIVMCQFQEAMPMAKRLAFTAAKQRDILNAPKDSYHKALNDLLACDELQEFPNVLPDSQAAVLQYTGGTTGIPKGAVLTHTNLYVNTLQCRRWITGDLKDGEETLLAVLPFFHVFAMTVALNMAIASGYRIVIHPRFELKHILKDIDEKKPTLLPGVSTLYATISNAPTLAKYDLSSIKVCVSGGGPLPLEVKDQFEKITGCKLIEGYGLTEASPVTSCSPLNGEYRRGSIGLPFPGTIMEIIDKDDHTRVLKPGEVGEVCIRGPQVMQGYLNKRDETDMVIRNGRLHTGDLGKVDEDGYFYIVDRLKEMIIVGGYNVYPRNVEEAIYTHPSVAECAVIGLTHPTRGQMIKAFVVKKEGTSIDTDELKKYLRGHMSAYSVPHEIELRDALPKSSVGKILKKELLAEEKAKHA